MDDIDRAVRSALADPQNQRSDGLRAGAVATCLICKERLTLVGVGVADSSRLDWEWRHMVNGNPVILGAHTPLPFNRHNWSAADMEEA